MMHKNLSVSLHSTNGRHLPAVRAMQGAVIGFWKPVEIPVSHETIIQVSAVITRSNKVKFCINNLSNCSRISIRCWVYKSHPMLRPNGRAMAMLEKTFFNVFYKNSFILIQISLKLFWFKFHLTFFIKIQLIITQQKASAGSSQVMVTNHYGKFQHHILLIQFLGGPLISHNFFFAMQFKYYGLSLHCKSFPCIIDIRSYIFFSLRPVWRLCRHANPELASQPIQARITEFEPGVQTPW